MPLGAPIGSGMGLQNLATLRILREMITEVPLIVDAGVGMASDVCLAMDMGARRSVDQLRHRACRQARAHGRGDAACGPRRTAVLPLRPHAEEALRDRQLAAGRSLQVGPPRAPTRLLQASPVWDRLGLMRVFGIDCGTNCTGYGVVDVHYGSRETRLIAVAAGGLKLAKDQPLPERLAYIYGELSALLELHRPQVVAVEGVFYSVNAKSALKLGHVRGVALLAAAMQGLPVAEYAPLTIKSAVVGYGMAQKEQVQFMVARLLGLDHAPQPADAADALAIAICHVHTAQTLSLQAESRT